MLGFLNVYKPQGMTSFDVVKKIKREVKPYKIGHLGTLDPMAEGVLPIAIGQATRLIEFIGNKSKIYRAAMKLGGISDTQDQWGTITFLTPKSYTKEEIQKVMLSFQGPIQQIPPMYSALHYQGQRLYELARKGITVERKPRDIFISQLDLLQITESITGQEITFRVQCSEGTYIRTLCHDIGKALGTGGYMTSLVREKWGCFSLENAISSELAVQEWSEHLINPLEVLDDLPRWYITEEEEKRILSGNSIPVSSDFPDKERVLLLSKEKEIFAIARKQSSGKKRWEAKPYKVFS